MKHRLAVLACLAWFPLASTALHGQSPEELRTVRAYETAVKSGPLALHAFLDQFPKGADLHVHLSGAIYAETFIKDAAEDGLCVDPRDLSFAKPPCAAPLMPATDLNGILTSAQQDLYDRLIDSFSMRSYFPTPGFSGHDQFFSTFGKFHGLSNKHIGEWVDEIASRSAAQNQQYLELMETPPFTHAATIAAQNPLNLDFAAYRHTLDSLMIGDEVFAGREDVRAAEQLRREIEHCDTPQATAACKVTVRYIYQVLRGNSPEQVFAQTLLGFETVQAAMNAHDNTFVGINFVMPEDGFISMRDYTLQMKMLEYFHSAFPKVHITLHAGEIVPGMVPPEGLRFHIRQAVDLGHAERIGHGVDVMSETRPLELLKEMADHNVMVEICLTSNDVILGVSGKRHPLGEYIRAGVPVALATDDEGVARSDMTHEYLRAAQDQELSYTQLKKMARTSLEHAFVSGASLWSNGKAFTPVKECSGEKPDNKPSAACQKFLDASDKAGLQWKLESQFREFESQTWTSPTNTTQPAAR